MCSVAVFLKNPWSIQIVKRIFFSDSVPLLKFLLKFSFHIFQWDKNVSLRVTWDRTNKAWKRPQTLHAKKESFLFSLFSILWMRKTTLILEKAEGGGGGIVVDSTSPFFLRFCMCLFSKKAFSFLLSRPSPQPLLYSIVYKTAFLYTALAFAQENLNK